MSPCRRTLRFPDRLLGESVMNSDRYSANAWYVVQYYKRGLTNMLTKAHKYLLLWSHTIRRFQQEQLVHSCSSRGSPSFVRDNSGLVLRRTYCHSSTNFRATSDSGTHLHVGSGGSPVEQVGKWLLFPGDTGRFGNRDGKNSSGVGQ
jgi:hypothetical protein